MDNIQLLHRAHICVQIFLSTDEDEENQPHFIEDIMAYLA